MEDRRIKASRTTYPEWTLSHEGEPEKLTKDEWIERAKPYNVYDYALMVYQDMAKRMPDARHIRIVTIDEEFEDWLEHEDLPYSLQSKIQYKNEISGADADRLLVKNRMNIAYYAMYLPVCVSAPQGETLHIPDRLSEETRRSMKGSLEQYYGEGSIYLPGDIFTPEEAFVSELRMQKTADEWFHNRIALPFHEKSKDLSEYTDAVLFIPFVYSAPCKKADIDLDKISLSHPEWLDPTDVSLEEDVHFSEDMTVEMGKDMNAVVAIGQCLVCEKEVETAYRSEREKILAGKKTKKRGVAGR